MSNDGVITRKQVIEDEALNWGAEYQKQVQLAIEKNKEFAKGIIEINEAAKQIKGSTNNAEYIKAKTKEIEISEKQGVVWREQIQLENQLVSAIKKKQLISESTSRALIKERVELQTTTKALKLEARERLGLVGTYEKLNTRRNKAQRTLANLLSVEKQNIAEVKKAQLEYQKLDARVKAVDAATKNYSKNVGNYTSAFQGLNQTARNLISTFGLLTGVALFGQIVKDIFSTIKEFDRQLIAVGKTTNIAGDDLKQFGKEVVELGDKLNGISVQGLLKSSEIAGQLGVKGTDNILRFSTAIEKLKLTSDIISDEQVRSFAKFIEVSEDSFENADRLASVITQLGNNFATTEAEVLSNASEIQKSISIYNASAESVLGLGAATSALGSRAETSRSAIQSTFKVIDKAISTGANLEKVLKLTNLTQKELSDQFNKDATGVFVKFVGGLKKAKDEGENLNNILDSVNITEKRATTVIGALAANYDVLTESVSQSTLEYQENLALNKEVEAASQSISSIISDVKDKWDAYLLSTDQANGGTQKIANSLKFLRDNLSGIIDGFIKYGSVLLAYFATMKLISFITSNYTALKTAAAAAELSFAVATGIGRKSVIAQAVAVKSATVAQTGLNIAMTATPWGIILAALAAVVVAYQVFNDKLSDNEKIQNRINSNSDKTEKSLEKTAKNNEEFYNKNIKQIEDEFALKRKKQGESKELDKEEIKAKEELLNNFIDTNNLFIKANDELLESTKKTSKEKLKILQAEVAEWTRLQGVSGGSAGIDAGKYKAQEKLNDLKVESQNQLNNLKLTNKQLLDENKKYQTQLTDLAKETTLKNAEIEKALADKKKRELLAAQKKLRKELFEAEKKANSDAYKLSQYRLKSEIDINNEIVKNEKSSLDEKLDALDVSNQKSIEKNKETLAYKLSQLGKYNEDTGKFIRQLTNAEISELIKTGESKKTLTDEQKLLYEKYQEALTGIAITEEQKRQAIIDKEINAIQKRIDTELQLKENDLNVELVSENDTYKSELEAAKGNYALIEKARIDHENRILAIQKRYALEGLNLQIDTLQNKLDENDALESNEQISADKRAKIVADLERFKKEASDLETENYTSNLITKEEAEQQFKQAVTDLAFQLKDALVDLTNAIFDAKISKIDAEIEKDEEKYARQLELAGDDQAQKDLIEIEAEKNREKLDKKKRKAARDAAIFNKIVSLGTIAAQTAMASIAALAPPPIGLGPVAGGALLPYIIGLGAVQAATVLATPLPKYEKGRKRGPEEFAIVGEKRQEVITDKFGNNPRLTPSTPTLTFLKEDDQVHSSVDEYLKLQRAATMASIAMEGKKTNDFQEAQKSFDNAYSKEMLEEMKQTRKAMERQKTIILKNKIDIPHSIWESKNVNWE